MKIKQAGKMSSICLLFGSFVLVVLTGTACATTLSEMVGDKDCFGLGGACSDGDHYRDDLGGIFFNDNRGIGEVLGVDEWETSSRLGGPVFTFGLDLGGATPISASLELFTAGIDLGLGTTFFFNGSSIGTYVEPIGQENRAATLVLPVPIALLSDPDSLSLSLAFSNDGFIIDYVKLSVDVIPEPTTLTLATLSLLAIAYRRRRSEQH